MIRGLVAGSYFQCGAQTLWSPKRYHSGQCIVVNFKQIQEVFVEALAIYLKYVEAFLTVLYGSAPVGLKATNQGGPQIGADAICNALAVTKPDKQIPQSSHACRFEGWQCLVSTWPPGIHKLLVWEVDALPVVWEDIKAAWVALASMMLPSGAELPKSLTDYVNCECSVQPVVFEWQVVTNRSITSVPHEENTGWRSFPLCRKGLAHMLSREHLPGCCMNLECELAWAWCPSGCKTWGDESLGRSVWTIWSRLPWWCKTQPWRCLTSGTVSKTWVEARTQLHPGALPPSPTYWCAGLPAAWTMSIAAYGSPAMPPSVAVGICKESDLCL